MFDFLYSRKNSTNRLVIFLILPIVFLINYSAGLFIGGVLLISSIIASVVLPMTLYGVYLIGCLLLFHYSIVSSMVPLKASIIQGTIFLSCLLIATFVGFEIEKHIIMLNKQREENCELTKDLINSFVAAIDAKDHYLHNHSFNVANYSRLIAEQLNYPAKEIEEICLAALFHDIGKLSVSEAILNKPSKLSDEEWVEMKLHASSGPKILDNVSQINYIFDYIKYHHRHFDGTGYPDDCPIESVPFESYIIAVADAFDAMTSDRPYRKALDLEVAYDELRKFSGTQFHPDVIQAFFDAEIMPDIKDFQEIDFNRIFGRAS